MPIVNRIAALTDEIADWRHDFHQHPELLYEVHRTAGIVADRLREFGCDEVTTGIGRTGVVGLIRGRGASSGRVIGLRADMDALPIEEASGVPYASKTAGLMHACGHDGHTAMLLGAAKYLAETRNFDGTAVVIFQPAEEGGAGGKAMVDDGLMTRWGIQQVFGLHNMPGMPEGHFALTPGPILAASDRFEITVHGKGGHGGAGPHRAVDSVLIATIDRRAQRRPDEDGRGFRVHFPRGLRLQHHSRKRRDRRDRPHLRSPGTRSGGAAGLGSR